MNHRLAISLLLTLILGTPAQALTKIVPVAGHAEGAFGTFWRSDLLLSNPVSQAQIVDLTFHPTGSAPVTRSIVLAPSDTSIIPDAVNPASFGLSPRSWIGQLVLTSAQGFHATAHTWTTSPLRAGTYGGVIESFDPLIIPSHGTVTGLQVSSRFRSNIAFANAQTAVNVLDFVVRGSAGQVVSTGRVQLAAHETRQLSVQHDLALAEGVYSLAWISSGPAMAIASVIDNVSGDPSNGPSIANARTAHAFPIAGRVDGAMLTVWKTSLSITSEGAGDAHVTLIYHATTELDAQKTVVIPANGTLFIEDLLAYLDAPNGLGYLRVEADVPIVAWTRIFNTDVDGATYGSLLLPQEPAVESNEIRIRGVRRTSEFRANVVLANRTGEPTTGWLRFFDRRGDMVERHFFALKAHHVIQVSLNGSVADIEAGEVEARTDDGVHILAIVSNVDNATGDTIVREAEQEIERQFAP